MICGCDDLRLRCLQTLAAAVMYISKYMLVAWRARERETCICMHCMCLHSGHGNMLTPALPISWAQRRIHIFAGRKSLADGTLNLFKYTVTQCWCRYSGYSLHWYMHTSSPSFWKI